MEAFELPVHYRGEELQFPAELKQIGYSHRIVVNVYGTEIFFEPDEERNYRALVDPDKLVKQVNAELLKAIAESIEAIVK